MSKAPKHSDQLYSSNIDQPHHRIFVLHEVDFTQLNISSLQYFVSAQSTSPSFKYFQLDALEQNEALFTYTQFIWEQFQILVLFEPEEKQLTLDCNCKQVKSRMCEHQYGALLMVLEHDHYAAFFDDSKKQKILEAEGEKYGISQEDDINRFFRLTYTDSKVQVNKVVPGLINPANSPQLSKQLLPEKSKPKELLKHKEKPLGILLNDSPYTSDMHVVLFEAEKNLKGSIKNPIVELNPLELMDSSEQVDEMRFYAALERLKLDNFNQKGFGDRMRLVKRMLENPLKIPIYRNKKGAEGKMSARSMEQVVIDSTSRPYIIFEVNKKTNFFEIISFIQIADKKKVNLSAVEICLEFFFQLQGNLFLVRDEYFLKVYQFMRAHQFRLLLHESKFGQFKEQYLDDMEGKVEVKYSFVHSAEPKTIEALANQTSTLQKTIYIEESDGYILMTPAVKYGRIEIPILSLRNVRDFDKDGVLYSYDRDKELENRFVGVLLRQHPDFEAQLGEFEYFYLTRQAFLDSGWFVNAFHEWRSLDIDILGFNSIKKNPYSQEKMQVQLNVSSEVDWFETKINLRFGNETADLRALQKAIKNHSRFVQLSDGKMGLLPEEWIKKFGAYLRSSKIVGSSFRTSKINYSAIENFTDEAELNTAVSQEINQIKQNLEGLDKILEVRPTKFFKATLRNYQQEGLNWLCHLDKFNLGGCLADDMGLGKTIQVLAFLCHQQTMKRGTSLIVAPTSILFNWLNETKRFAPSLNVGVNHGSSRIKSGKEMLEYDIILTTYGMVLSEQKKFQSIDFNYIILDESQNIKNPTSQRYKAICQLHSRNKIAMTGTPIENNTFDLYAQFSFLNPGMFVNQTRFKEQYSIPIDKFKDAGRAAELQQKIKPFLLRRTKRQVAKELPEKTEMVFECEMDDEQRNVYDAYLKQIRDELNNPQQRRIKGQYRVLMLQGLTKLRQICNAPTLLPDEADFGSSSAKINVLMREIEARHKRHKILVFSQFVGMLELIQARLQDNNIGHTLLTGQSKNRGDLVNNFKTVDDTRVFLISLKAGGVGLNLTEADYVFIVDPWWNPAIENQAIDRCYRIGQTKKVVAIRLVTPNSIEEKIMALQERKKELSDELVKTDEDAMNKLTDVDLVQLFE